MIRRSAAIAFAVALLSAAACGGHGGTIPSGGSQAGGYQSFDWGRSAMSGATYLGPATQGGLHVNVVPRLRDGLGLIQYAQAVSDPSSPSYRHYLTPQQIGQRFGASDADYIAVANYFASQGLSIAGWPQHLGLHVSGPIPAMERAFGVKMGYYQRAGVRFIAPVGEPRLARAVPVVGVSNLVAYNASRRNIIAGPPRASNGYANGFSPQQVRAAFDFTGAYSASAGGHAIDGTGINVGIIGTGPIDVNRSTWCGDADLAHLQALYANVNAAHLCEVNVTASAVAAGLAQSGIPTPPPATPNPAGTPPVGGINYFPYSNSFTTPPPVTSPYAPGCSNGVVPLSSFGLPHSPNCNPEDNEAQLDTQQISTLAPGSNVLFYLAYNSNDCFVYFPNTCQAATPSPAPPTPTPGATSTPSPQPNLGYPEEGIIEADAEIEQAIGDNVADVISISYGGGETDNEGFGYDASGHGYQTTEMAALAAEGIAVFVSTGDAGSTECSASSACVSYPASDPNVTAVGGVNAPLNELGQLTANMTAWGNTNGGNGGTTAGNWSGTGGGTSQIFAAPSWQQAALGATRRLQPDVSMIGDPDTGVTVYVNANFGGGYFPIGGTSVAAPQMAAMWALVLQGCKATPACTVGGPAGHTYRLGNAAPYLYSVYKNLNLSARPAFTPFLPYSQVFYDVVYGGNAMYLGNGKYVTGYSAGPGFDQVTGVGVPYAGHLVQSITGVTAP